MNTSVSPNNKTLIKNANSSTLEKVLTLRQKRKAIQKTVLWAIINIALVSLLLYNLSYTCPYSYYSYPVYIQYVLVVLFTINSFYHITKIVILTFNSEQIPITPQQKKLLGISDLDSSFKMIENQYGSIDASPNTTFNTSLRSRFSSTPMNTSALSWQNSPSNKSGNYSSLSSSWTYMKGIQSPTLKPSSTKNSPQINSFFINSDDDIINDETSLGDYLREQENIEKINTIAYQSQNSPNLLSSFWRNPFSKNSKDVSSILSKCSYQISPLSKEKRQTGTPKPEENISQNSFALEPWTRLNIDIVELTQWNENLRKWISQTILERITQEFDLVNQTLQKHGLNDMVVGEIGLDRLRKIAYTVPIAHIVPSMSTLIPFLEVTTNQEYLVKRIRQLSQGGCMSDFCWNKGGKYNGKDWNDSLPTDSAIIMHLLATYLDIQLIPLPNAPDIKPFSGYHYVKFTDKYPKLSDSTIFIHQVTEKPPHYRVVVKETIYELAKGYNNLFHTILFFLYHMNLIGQGMMGRVNLGRAGINMLWIIDQ